MSTTIKRIALVAVAALGLGVLSVAPSQAAVQDLTVTVTANGTPTLTSQDTTTAAAFTVAGLLDASSDTVSVTVIQKTIPALATTPTVLLGFVETTTVATKADNQPVWAAQLAKFESTTSGITLSGGVAYVGATFTLQFESLTATLAGTYTYTVIAKPYTGGAPGTAKTADVTLTIAAAAVVAAAVPAAASAKAYTHAGDTAYPDSAQLADSATSGSFIAGVRIGTLQVRNLSTTSVLAKDTMTVTMTGSGYLAVTAPSAVVGRSFVIANAESFTADIKADGTAGVGTITITTAAGASFVKTVTFFDTKPKTVTATVKKAFIKAGTGVVLKTLAVTVVDGAGNAVTNATITAAPTDTATTVGGAATCLTYDTTDKVYYCGIAGLSSTKFGAVAYTITAAGADVPSTKVTTTASVTFADSVATKAVLAGPATGTPGATVDYTLTLTEKNGYPVADQTYGVVSAGGVLFGAKSTDRVVSGWSTAPFSATESFTSVSGVITSKGILPIAGVATGSWILVGDGLQTLTENAIDKTIGKTTLTVTTETTNPGVDAATDAANEATDAANAATDAALAAAEAADAATTAAQEASDAVAALSETVTKLISDLQAQIKSLAAVVAKIAKKVKA
jgi:hypothetical protein